jgi:hypothetical protein
MEGFGSMVMCRKRRGKCKSGLFVGRKLGTQCCGKNGAEKKRREEGPNRGGERGLGWSDVSSQAHFSFEQSVEDWPPPTHPNGNVCFGRLWLFDVVGRFVASDSSFE